MTEVAARSVTIVGLGVVGGSLARAVLGRLPGVPVFGLDPDPECADPAARDGVEVLARLEDGDVEGGFVIFAAPLDATVRLVRETAGAWRRAVLAMDVASLKRPVLDAAAESSPATAASPRPQVFVGAHPMCGSERSGYTAARADLFEGADIWVCPWRDNPPPGAGTSTRGGGRIASRRAIEQAVAFWRALGGRPRTISATRHDRIMAWASHLPQLVANALAAAMQDEGLTRAQLGPGGRSMTRLSGSSPAMWLPLLKDVAELDAAALRAVEQQIGAIRRTMETGDWAAVEELMLRGRRWATEED